MASGSTVRMHEKLDLLVSDNGQLQIRRAILRLKYTITQFVSSAIQSDNLHNLHNRKWSFGGLAARWISHRID